MIEAISLIPNDRVPLWIAFMQRVQRRAPSRRGLEILHHWLMEWGRASDVLPPPLTTD
jgi:hypothetical protein